MAYHRRSGEIEKTYWQWMSRTLQGRLRFEWLTPALMPTWLGWCCSHYNISLMPITSSLWWRHFQVQPARQSFYGWRNLAIIIIINNNKYYIMLRPPKKLPLEKNMVERKKKKGEREEGRERGGLERKWEWERHYLGAYYRRSATFTM